MLTVRGIVVIAAVMITAVEVATMAVVTEVHLAMPGAMAVDEMEVAMVFDIRPLNLMAVEIGARTDTTIR